MKFVLTLSTFCLILACTQPVNGTFTLDSISNETQKTESFDYAIILPSFTGSVELEQFSKTLKQEIETERDSVQQEALAAKDLPYNNWPYSFNVNFNLFESKTVTNSHSLVVKVYQFTGGAHGLTDARVYNFLGTKPAEWDTFFKPNANFVLLGLIDEKIKKNLALPQEERLYFDDAKVENLDDLGWYFDDENLNFIFPLYSIAPYVAGLITMSFSLQDLAERGLLVSL